MTGKVSSLANQLSNIVADLEYEHPLSISHKQQTSVGQSPFIGGVMDGNKISAIGLPENARKESPFWEDNGDNIFELHPNDLYGPGTNLQKKQEALR